MGYYEDSQLVLRSEIASIEEIQQFMESYGLNVEKDILLPISFAKLEENEVDEIYQIASKLFKKVSLDYRQSEENSVVDSYIGLVLKYNDNNNGMKEKEECNYCIGEYTIDDNSCWSFIQKEIEEKAKERGIEIEWNNNDSELEPDDYDEDFYDLCQEILEGREDFEELISKPNYWNILKDEIENEAKEREIEPKWKKKSGLWPEGEEGDDFYDLCDEILEEHGGIEGLATKTTKETIKTIEINKEVIQEMADNAERLGFRELLNRIKKEFNI